MKKDVEFIIIFISNLWLLTDLYMYKIISYIEIVNKDSCFNLRCVSHVYRFIFYGCVFDLSSFFFDNIA